MTDLLAIAYPWVKMLHILRSFVKMRAVSYLPRLRAAIHTGGR